MTAKNVAIMFPNNSVALMIGQTVTGDMANIGLFIPPESVHEQAAGTTLQDLSLASAELADVTVKRLSHFTDLAPFEIVVFPVLICIPANQDTNTPTCATISSGMLLFLILS